MPLIVHRQLRDLLVSGKCAKKKKKERHLKTRRMNIKEYEYYLHFSIRNCFYYCLIA